LPARPRPRRRGRISSPGRPGSFDQEAVVAWIYLFFAGVLEIVWAFSMKQSEGFTKLGPSVVTVVTMIASFALLSLAMKTLPLGTAYTIWTGIGAVGAFAVGVLVLGEPASALRMVAAVLIVSGLVLMKLASPV
jgi:quaternary ammonium compound-resistance protein SugE